MNFEQKILHRAHLFDKALLEKKASNGERAFYYLCVLYYNRVDPILPIIKYISECWEKYSRRFDIELDDYLIPKAPVAAFNNMNEAFDVPVYTKQKVYYNFIKQPIKHDYFINDKISSLKPGEYGIPSAEFLPIAEFMDEKNKATMAESAFTILSYCYKNLIPIPLDAIKTIADGWCIYSQRSDLAKISFNNIKVRNVTRFKTLNDAFDIPIYTNGRVRKEFYCELVYKSLASLRAQGVFIDNEVHNFVGYKYGFSGGTSKNYYYYLLKRGAPSVSGRLKVINKGTFLNIPFSPIPEDLDEFKSSKWKEYLKQKKSKRAL
jgi:hypothetical protein